MMLYWILQSLAFIGSKILFRLEVRGKDNIPRTGGFILASNHVSYLDPVVLTAACSRQLSFIARHDLFSIPFFGALIRRLGAFPVRRNFADITSIKEALQRLKQARGLLLFPEGSRVSNGLVDKPKPGISFIAIKSRVPVVPAFIEGSQRAFGRNMRFIRPIKIKIYFGELIYPNSNNKRNPKDNYEYFSRRVIEEIKRLREFKG